MQRSHETIDYLHGDSQYVCPGPTSAFVQIPAHFDWDGENWVGVGVGGSRAEGIRCRENPGERTEISEREHHTQDISMTW